MIAGTLCSGVGGLDLGLERAGCTIAWQAENDPWCAAVLHTHWPDVPNLGDITQVDWSTVERVELVAAGYPCQPFSFGGHRRGTDDERHLWPYVRDAIRALRPELVLLENVPGHLSLGLDEVLADLSELGFDAEWEVVSACAVGASHTRARLFVVAYPAGSDVAGALSCCAGETARDYGRSESRGSGSGESRPGRWLSEPALDRMADGLPRSVVRAPLEALGNAVVPQVAEMVASRLVGARRRGVMAEPVTFVYDGNQHDNEFNSCFYSALKGVVRSQECEDDWRVLRRCYSWLVEHGLAKARSLRGISGDSALREE